MDSTIQLDRATYINSGGESIFSIVTAIGTARLKSESTTELIEELSSEWGYDHIQISNILNPS